MDAEKYKGYFDMLSKWMYLRNTGCFLTDHKLLKNRIAVYGYGKIGQRFVEELTLSGNPPQYIIDKGSSLVSLISERTTLAYELKAVDVIVVTVVFDYIDIEKQLIQKLGNNTNGTRIVSINSIINDLLQELTDEYLI